jgi:hypothetical protein
MVQARLSNAANFNVTLADTGLVNAEAQDESQGNIVLVFPAPVTARYLRVDLTDGAAPYMDIGLLVAGHPCGIAEGRLMLDRHGRDTLEGTEFPVPAVANPRMARFTVPLLTSSETRHARRRGSRPLDRNPWDCLRRALEAGQQPALTDRTRARCQPAVAARRWRQ